MEKITLYTVPFAGGHEYSYRDFQENLSSNNIKSFPLSLSYNEKQDVKDLNEIADIIFNQLKKNIQVPYALFGHSMGAWLVYLVARKLVEEKLPLPTKIIVSGAAGPSIPRKKNSIHKLDDNDFVKEVAKLGGMPQALTSNQELLNYFLPRLRADIEALETFQYVLGQPLPIPLIVCNGNEEHFDSSDIEAWQKESSFIVDIISMKGGHFYIFDKTNNFSGFLTEKLQNNN